MVLRIDVGFKKSQLKEVGEKEPEGSFLPFSLSFHSRTPIRIKNKTGSLQTRQLEQKRKLDPLLLPKKKL